MFKNNESVFAGDDLERQYPRSMLPARLSASALRCELTTIPLSVDRTPFSCKALANLAWISHFGVKN